VSWFQKICVPSYCSFTIQDEVDLIIPEEYCAASIAEYSATALVEATSAREQAFGRLANGLNLPKVDWANGTAIEATILPALVAHGIAPPVKAELGQLLDASTRSGVVAGVGLGMFVEYTHLPSIIPSLLRGHLRVFSDPTRGVLDESSVVSDADEKKMLAEAENYSKIRSA
jgi:hypothetical protein